MFIHIYIYIYIYIHTHMEKAQLETAQLEYLELQLRHENRELKQRLEEAQANFVTVVKEIKMFFELDCREVPVGTAGKALRWEPPDM